MRTIFSLFFALSVSWTVARELFVVVYTSDATVVEFYCADPEGRSDVAAHLPVRVQSSQGTFQWHAVGGLAPYTAIRTERAGDGTYCVTVIDAAGNVATGCGVIQTFVQRKTVSCRAWKDDVPVQGVLLTPPAPKAAVERRTKPRVTVRTVAPDRPVRLPRDRQVRRYGGLEPGNDRPGGTVVRGTSERPGQGGGQRPTTGTSGRPGGTGVAPRPPQLR